MEMDLVDSTDKGGMLFQCECGHQAVEESISMEDIIDELISGQEALGEMVDANAENADLLRNALVSSTNQIKLLNQEIINLSFRIEELELINDEKVEPDCE